MTTQCLYCTKFKEYNCSYCGDPVCGNHVVADTHMRIFCGITCLKSLEQRELKYGNY